jgi:hypothetical protein
MLPKLTDAQSGFFIPQSQQVELPGMDLITAWSAAVIWTMMVVDAL